MDYHSQLTDPQNTHLKKPKRLENHDATPLTFNNEVLRPDSEERVSGEEELESTTGMRRPHEVQVRDASHSLFPHTADPVDSSEPVVAPVTMHLQGAHIGGNTRLTNVRGNYVTNSSTVNNYGETNGLERLEKFVSFEAQFDSSAQDPDRQCHPGTRKNVLKRVRDWIDNPNSTDRIFWLYGPAGAGKSAIAQTIARSCARPKVAASFFFFRSDIKRNDGNRLFTTLAYQLALSMPEIRNYIVHSLSEHPDLPWKNIETQFEQLLVRPFQVLNEDASQQLAPAAIIDVVKKYQQLAPVIIIDGVDECTDDNIQQRFLKVIGDAVEDHRFPLRFLIVSRPELHIEQTICHFQSLTLTFDLAGLDDANKDIKKYLVEQFFRIASNQGLDPAWPGQEIIDDIVYKSSGNFIFPSLVIRFIDDPDNVAENQLDIVLNLKPPTTMTPFAILDQLFVEILGRVPDQVFLKNYLALLVVRISSSISADDDTVLMHVSEKELHAKLRRMRSLLKFNHYYIRKQDRIKGYLEVFVDSLVRYISAVTEKPDHHNLPHFTPRFREKVKQYPPKIVLRVKEWQEVAQPLLDLQEKLLQLPNFSIWDRLRRCNECTAFHLMREIQQQAVLSRVAFVGENMSVRNLQTHRGVISSIVTITAKNMDNNLDSILLELFALVPETMENFSPNDRIIDLMNAILRFDNAETVTMVRSVLDVQKLVNLLDYMIHSKNALHQDVTSKACFLASEIFAKVSIVFPPYLLNKGDQSYHYTWHKTIYIEILSQTIFAYRILDHRYIAPVEVVKANGTDSVSLFSGVAHSLLSMTQWRRGSIPSSVTVIQIMLKLAKAIQYFHLMGVLLYHEFLSHNVLLDSNLCPKIRCLYSTSRSLLDQECQEWFSPEGNIFSFGCLLYEMYAGVNIWPDSSVNSRKRIIRKRPSVPEIPEYAWQLIQHCCAEHPKSRPTIDEVVADMKGWHDVGHVEPGEAVNEFDGWHKDARVEPSDQGRTCFQALGSVLSDLRRNLC